MSVQKYKKEKYTLSLLFITLLVSSISFGLIIPIKPQLIMDITKSDLATTASWGGYLLLGYSLAQFLVGPIMVALSDRYGRKSIIVIALAASTLDYLIMGISQHIFLLFIARIFSGAFASTLATINASIADISSPEKRAVNFGIINSAFGLGLMLGPSIGGFVGEYWGTRAPLYFASIVSAINLLLVYLFLPETIAQKIKGNLNFKKLNAFSILIHLKNTTKITSFLFVYFLLQLAFHSFAAIWAYYMIEKFNWNFSEIGWSLFVVGATNLLVQGGLIRIIIPKVGEKKALNIGLIFMIPSFFAYAFAYEGWMIYFIIILGGIGGIAIPSLQGMMSKMLPNHQQGELMGAITSIRGLGMIAGPLLMTQTFSFFTNDTTSFYFPGAPFIVSGILVVTAMLLIQWTFIKNLKEVPK